MELEVREKENIYHGNRILELNVMFKWRVLMKYFDTAFHQTVSQFLNYANKGKAALKVK